MAPDEGAGILGISLVHDQVRIVEGVKLSANEFQVNKVAHGRVRQAFTFDVFEDKNMPRRFAEDIMRLCEAHKIEVKNAAFSLDSRMVMVKRLAIDRELKLDDLREHVEWEVRQFVISPVDEYVVDFEQLHTDENGDLNSILVVVVRKKVVQFLKKLFKHTDLKLKVVDVDVFSAQRALQVNYDSNSSDKICLIDVEGKKIHFSILKGRNFFLTHEVSTSENGAAEDGLSLTRLISKELRRIILDHQLGKGVEDLNEVYLYGEAVDDSVLEGLQNAYDVHIDCANPFRRIKLLAQAKEDVSQTRGERYMISVGAALRGIQ